MPCAKKLSNEPCGATWMFYMQSLNPAGATHWNTVEPACRFSWVLWPHSSTMKGRPVKHGRATAVYGMAHRNDKLREETHRTVVPENHDDRVCHCHPNETSKLTRKLSIGPHHAALTWASKGLASLSSTRAPTPAWTCKAQSQPSGEKIPQIKRLHLSRSSWPDMRFAAKAKMTNAT